ncbi:MAG: PrgI family protein [Candidatus Paceibacterota bacterium]
MATFQVPQFIEEETKIIGPLTMIQFAYVGVSVGISLIAFYTLGSFLGIFFGIICISLGVSLAFVEINGQKLPKLIKSAAFYWQKPKTYTWQREEETETLDISGVEKIEAVRKSMSLQQKIKSATLEVTTGSKLLFKKRDQSKLKNRYQTIRYSTGERDVAKRVDYKAD